MPYFEPRRWKEKLLAARGVTPLPWYEKAPIYVAVTMHAARNTKFPTCVERTDHDVAKCVTAFQLSFRRLTCGCLIFAMITTVEVRGGKRDLR